MRHRQFRIGESTVQAQPAAEVVWRDGEDHAVPECDMSARRSAGLWCREVLGGRDRWSEDAWLEDMAFKVRIGCAKMAKPSYSLHDAAKLLIA